MWHLIRPDQYCSSIHTIDYGKLIDQGVGALVFDLDNTLVAWGEEVIGEDVMSRIQTLKGLGFSMCIVSNNLGRRVAAISDRLGIPATSGALKPLTFGYKRALRILRSEPNQTALIGDQLFTDVLGGNLAGLHTILVDPIAEREFITTRFVRKLERVARRRLGLAGTHRLVE